MFNETLVIPEEQLARNKEQWKLTGNFLGNKVLELEFLAHTLCQRWKIKESYDIIPMRIGFLTFKFQCEESKFIVKTEGPWPTAGSILALEDWRKNF